MSYQDILVHVRPYGSIEPVEVRLDREDERPVDAVGRAWIGFARIGRGRRRASDRVVEHIYAVVDGLVDAADGVGLAGAAGLAAGSSWFFLC